MLKKVIIVILMSIVTSYGVEEQNIKPVLDKKIKEVIQVLKNPSLSMKQKEKKSIEILDPIFSYPTMAKISLGKKWKTLSKEEKAAFTHVFEHKMKHSYIDKLKLYKNQKVITTQPKKIKKNRIILTTKIIGNHDTYKIVNAFFKKKHTNQWYVYDVKLAGVSIIQTYRKQFSAFLKTKSFQQLLQSL